MTIKLTKNDGQPWSGDGGCDNDDSGGDDDD